MATSFASMAPSATLAFTSSRNPNFHRNFIFSSHSPPSSSDLRFSTIFKHDVAALSRGRRRSHLEPLGGVPSAQAPVVIHEVGDEEEVDSATTLRDICKGRVPDLILQRAEEVGFVVPTEVQRKALPLMLSGRDCILHAQTGSGKTLAYLFAIFSAINLQHSAVQALIVVPTRELGMQVTKVVRMLSARPVGSNALQKSCTIMALLDGGTLKRHKVWLKAEPPQIVVATIGSLTLMLEKKIFNLEKMQVLVVDEVDFMFHSPKQVQSVKKVLTSFSTINTRQTIFASASIPQHNHFLADCIQQKWTKKDAVHIHVNPVQPMPTHICHKYVICTKNQKLHILLALLEIDSPMSAIIFVNDQSEKSKKAGDTPSAVLVLEFLRDSYKDGLEIHLLEEDMHFNERAASISEVREGCSLLIATDLVARGVDLPETSNIYNFDLPKTAIDYLHRAGRTCRKPFSDEKYSVTSLITEKERFVIQRFENELLFHCEEVDALSP